MTWLSLLVIVSLLVLAGLMLAAAFAKPTVERSVQEERLRLQIEALQGEIGRAISPAVIRLNREIAQWHSLTLGEGRDRVRRTAVASGLPDPGPLPWRVRAREGFLRAAATLSRLFSL